MPVFETPPDFNPSHFPGSFFDVAKAVLIAPKDFFSNMTRHGNMANPIIFLFGCVGVHTLLARPFHHIPGLFLNNVLMGVIVPFLTSGLFFLILTRLFHCRGTYEATFRMNAYASAVGLLTWIPVAGIFLEFYRLYVIIIGLRTIYAIKTSRAIITIFLTLIVYTVLFRIVYNITGGPFFSLPG